MPKYDFYCASCDKKEERSCSYEERASQRCEACTSPLDPLFSPPSVIRIPNAFRYTFSDLFGTSSEKDFRKANPDLVPAREAESIERPKDKLRRKKAEADKTVAEIERAIKANRTLVDGGTSTEI